MGALSNILFLALAIAQPDTSVRSGTIHVRQVLTDTIQDVRFTTDVSVDRRIRLSLAGGSIDKNIVTAWVNADTAYQWLRSVGPVVAAHQVALTGVPVKCGSQDNGPTEASIIGHLFVLGSSVAVMPIQVQGMPVYKVDVMDADQDRTATLGVTHEEIDRIAGLLSVAVQATRLLSNVELRKDGPLTVQRVKRLRSPGPVYPKALCRLGIEGSLKACFVVDTTGRVDMATFETIQSTDPAFTKAVRTALIRDWFIPVSIEGHKYRQEVSETYQFTLAKGGAKSLRIP